MTISVCMGIYNGEKYIEQQLKSIYEQSLQPDEVILCDDGSTDKTVEIIEKFILNNELTEKWTLYRNTENKGYPQNFYYAMNLCRGDVVFFADQDDIWKKDKFAQMCEIFAVHKEANVVSCKFGLIDEYNRLIRSALQPTVSKESNSIKRISIEKFFYKCEWPGMVLAYRRSWYEEKREKISAELKVPHDFLICAWAAEEDSFFQLDRELAYHRRHSENVGMEEYRVGEVLKWERKCVELKKYISILQELQRENILFREKGEKALENKMSSMLGRHEALKTKKLLKVMKNFWKYRREMRWLSMIGDVMIILTYRNVRGEKRE